MAFYDDTTQRDEGTIDAQNNRLRPNRISSFSADGRGNFSRMDSLGGVTQREDWGADYDRLMEQKRMNDEFEGLSKNAKAVKRNNEQVGFNAINSAMKASMMNGGTLPANAIDMLNRKLGFDGKNRAVFRAGYLANGDYDLDIAERGPNGQVQMRSVKYPMKQQYDMMFNAPGVWG